MTHHNQPQVSLREQLIEKYIEVAMKFYFEDSDEKSEREEYAPKFADEMLALFEATAKELIGEEIKARPGCGLYRWQVEENKRVAEQLAHLAALLRGEES